MGWLAIFLELLMAIASIDEIKKVLDIAGTDTTLDSVIGAHVRAAENLVKKYLGYNVERKVYANTEFHDGNGTNLLRVRNIPIYSVEAIYVDSDAYAGQGAGAWPAADLLTSGSDYMIRFDNHDGDDVKVSMRGHIIRVRNFASYSALSGTLGAIWPKGNGNIRVDYTAGWLSSDIPDVFKIAVSKTIDQMIGGSEELASLKLGDASMSFANQGVGFKQTTGIESIPDEVAGWLAPYRRRKIHAAGYPSWPSR